MGYSPWGCKELDTIEQLTLSLSFQVFIMTLGFIFFLILKFFFFFKASLY